MMSLLSATSSPTAASCRTSTWHLRYRPPTSERS
jgi:hypothetical protein